MTGKINSIYYFSAGGFAFDVDGHRRLFAPRFHVFLSDNFMEHFLH